MILFDGKSEEETWWLSVRYCGRERCWRRPIEIARVGSADLKLFTNNGLKRGKQDIILT